MNKISYVGENGPELFFPDAREIVFPVPAAARKAEAERARFDPEAADIEMPYDTQEFEDRL